MTDWQWLSEIEANLNDKSSRDYQCSDHGILDSEAKKLVSVVKEMREALKLATGAMTYAYEDHSDQYYLNVKAQLDEALARCAEGKI